MYVFDMYIYMYLHSFENGHQSDINYFYTFSIDCLNIRKEGRNLRSNFNQIVYSIILIYKRYML